MLTVWRQFCFFPGEIIELTNWLYMQKSHNKLSAITFAKKCWFFILGPQGNFKQDEILAPLPLFCVCLLLRGRHMPTSAYTGQSLKAWLLSYFLLLKVKDTDINDCYKSVVTLGSRNCKAPQNRSFSVRSSSPQNETVPQGRAVPEDWGLLWAPL